MEVAQFVPVLRCTHPCVCVCVRERELEGVSGWVGKRRVG